MCMSSTTRTYSRPSKQVKIGWKVLRKEKGENIYHTPIRGCISFQKGKWYHDKAKGRITDFYGKEYRKGFHIFTTRQDARQYGHGVPVKIEYTNIVAEGFQNGLACVIARSIKIL